MATTISGTNGVSQIQDGIVTDGKLDLTANSAEVKEALNASGTAPIYACRAWVSFTGTGTVAIQASGNVSSITDNGTGNYTANFATDIQDKDYCVSLSTNRDSSIGGQHNVPERDVSFVRVSTHDNGSTSIDHQDVHIAIFR